MPVHSSCDWGFIALLPVAVLTDSLKIRFRLSLGFRDFKSLDLIADSVTTPYEPGLNISQSLPPGFVGCLGENLGF
jgi:hypothetical protein